ncbi:kinesin-like protein KIN-14G [Senna tora]|uniref:Kinesin-like protein KIN-14G n=1 Tax=Senna tora TaxID=362788 RepID=A0A835C862_9FABA|nr:kinesin-like protein KIN-14G [Senna tora]
MFQQGQWDIMECLNRAYGVIDELRNSVCLPQQDPFFDLTNRSRSNRRTGLNADPTYSLTHFNCHWNYFPSTNRKVFDIARYQADHSHPLCYLVTDKDQDARLAMFRTIRLFLETYGTETMDLIAITVPDQHTLHTFYNTSKANTRYHTIIRDIKNICSNKNIFREFLPNKKLEEIPTVVESLLSKVVEECERRVLIQHEMVYACFFFIMFSFIINDTFTQVFCSDEHSNNMLDKLQDAIGRGQYQILILEYQDRVPNILMIGFRRTSEPKSN